MSDDEHWLFRLESAGWIAAARGEIVRGHSLLASRSHRRTVVTHARRAAGMALNAVLVQWTSQERETVWGRSYLEHLRAVADGRGGPWQDGDVDEARRLATRVLAIPVHAPELVPLGGMRGTELAGLLADAIALVELCERTVQRMSTAVRT